jgi:cytochrome P450
LLSPLRFLLFLFGEWSKRQQKERTGIFCFSYKKKPKKPQKQKQGGFVIPAGSDLFLSVWNLHRDPGRWKDADDFIPERFGPVDDVVAVSAGAGCPRSGSPPSPSAAASASSSSYVVPNEITESFSYLPFGGGKRKCIGDQFALFESVTALAIFARRVRFRV